MSPLEHQRQLVASLRLDLIDLAEDGVPGVRPSLAVLCEMAVERLRTTCPETAGRLSDGQRLAEVVAALLARQVVEADRPASPDEFDRAFLEVASQDADAEVRAAAERELEGR
jgi:hypothetical protein